LTVTWPGIPIVIVPAQAHWQVDPAVSTGTPLITTFAEPGVHGPTGTGTQGIGVRTPRAADVAAATAGFAGELHIPNVGMFAIGIESAMVATGCPPAVTGGPFGTAVSGIGGPRPIAHDSMAALTTSGGIVWLSPAPASARTAGRPGSDITSLARQSLPDEAGAVARSGMPASAGLGDRRLAGSQPGGGRGQPMIGPCLVVLDCRGGGRMREPLVIAVAQPPCVPHDVAVNAATHAATVRAAGARVVAFPELSLTGYELDARSVSAEDPRLSPLIEACGETGSLALVGAPVLGAEGGSHIAILAVQGTGARVAYLKMWLGGNESGRFTPGSGPAVLQIDGWRLGLAICRDTGIPRHAADTAGLGIDVYVAGMLELAEDAAVLDERAVRIATDHGVWVALASFAGSTGGGYARAAGGSGIWAPGGAVVSRVGPGTGAIARATLFRVGAIQRGAHEDVEHPLESVVAQPQPLPRPEGL